MSTFHQNDLLFTTENGNVKQICHLFSPVTQSSLVEPKR